MRGDARKLDLEDIATVILLILTKPPEHFHPERRDRSAIVEFAGEPECGDCPPSLAIAVHGKIWLRH